MRSVIGAAAGLLAVCTLAACDPGYGIAVVNQSEAALYFRIAEGEAIEVFEVPAGASGYGPTGLGASPRRIAILDHTCQQLWSGSVSTGTLIITVGIDRAITTAEGSLEAFVTPLAPTQQCGANTYVPLPSQSAGI